MENKPQKTDPRQMSEWPGRVNRRRANRYTVRYRWLTHGRRLYYFYSKHDTQALLLTTYRLTGLTLAHPSCSHRLARCMVRFHCMVNFLSRGNSFTSSVSHRNTVIVKCVSRLRTLKTTPSSGGQGPNRDREDPIGWKLSSGFL